MMGIAQRAATLADPAIFEILNTHNLKKLKPGNVVLSVDW